MAPETNAAAMVTCQVCAKQSPKYRCPRCQVRYCSLTCFKQHKLNTCGTQVQERTQVQSGSAAAAQQEDAVAMETWDAGLDEDEEDRVPLERLQKLQDSEELQHLLWNPHLRGVIREVDSSDDPEVTLRRAMQEPLFVEFVDQCLKVVEPQPNGTEQG